MYGEKGAVLLAQLTYYASPSGRNQAEIRASSSFPRSKVVLFFQLDKQFVLFPVLLDATMWADCQEEKEKTTTQSSLSCIDN